MFDYFKSLFDDFFGKDDDDEPGGFSPDDDDISFSPSTDGFDFSSYIELEDRLIENDEGGEFVNDFFSLSDAVSYVEGTPENVLKINIEPDGEIYHVYRFASE